MKMHEHAMENSEASEEGKDEASIERVSRQKVKESE